MTTTRLFLAWFAAGLGWDLQGRLIDGLLDPLLHQVTWLAWLAN